MLALVRNEAQHRGLTSCVMTFEPHPRDYFAAVTGKPEPRRRASPRCATSSPELERCGIDQVVVLRFDARFASQSPQAFIDDVLVEGLGAKYVLVGDDFRFGARRAGDYAMLDAAGAAAGFDVARMLSYEIHGGRVSSSAVRDALAGGDMERAALLGRPYSLAGHVVHGKLGRSLGFKTSTCVSHPRPAALGIFVVQVHGLADEPLDGVASLGGAPIGGRQRPRAARSALPRMAWPPWAPRGPTVKSCAWELLHKLRDEARFDSLEALTAAIRKDADDARAFLAGACIAATPDHARPNLALVRPPTATAGARRRSLTFRRATLASPSAMTDTSPVDYRATLNLPDTPFLMRRPASASRPG